MRCSVRDPCADRSSRAQSIRSVEDTTRGIISRAHVACDRDQKKRGDACKSAQKGGGESLPAAPNRKAAPLNSHRGCLSQSRTSFLEERGGDQSPLDKKKPGVAIEMKDNGALYEAPLSMELFRELLAKREKRKAPLRRPFSYMKPRAAIT